MALSNSGRGAGGGDVVLLLARDGIVAMLLVTSILSPTGATSPPPDRSPSPPSAREGLIGIPDVGSATRTMSARQIAGISPPRGRGARQPSARRESPCIPSRQDGPGAPSSPAILSFSIQPHSASAMPSSAPSSTRNPLVLPRISCMLQQYRDSPSPGGGVCRLQTLLRPSFTWVSGPVVVGWLAG
jgi:hypothetical protein